MTRGGFARKLVGFVLLAAASIFLTLTIRRNWNSLERFDWSVDPLLLAASIVGLSGVLAWGVWIWSRVLVHFEAQRISTLSLQRIWFLSNLARYIPGKVWQFVGVAQLARSAGIPAALLLTSMVVHVLFTILAAAVITGLLLPYSALGLHAWRPVGVVLSVVAGLVLVHPAIVNAGLNLSTRLTRQPILTWSGSWTDGVRLFLLSVVSWILYGAVFYLFLLSLTPVPLQTLPALVAVNALSFLAGYFAFLPAGIGVREAVMAALLDPVLPTGVAAVLAVLSRLWMIAAELLGALVAWLAYRHARTVRASVSSQ